MGTGLGQHVTGERLGWAPRRRLGPLGGNGRPLPWVVPCDVLVAPASRSGSLPAAGDPTRLVAGLGKLPPFPGGVVPCAIALPARRWLRATLEFAVHRRLR